MDKNFTIHVELKDKDDLRKGISSKTQEVSSDANKAFSKILAAMQEMSTMLKKSSESFMKTASEVATELSIKGFEGEDKEKSKPKTKKEEFEGSSFFQDKSLTKKMDGKTTVRKGFFEIIDYKQTRENRKLLEKELDAAIEAGKAYREEIEKEYQAEVLAAEGNNEKIIAAEKKKQKELAALSLKMEELRVANVKNSKGLSMDFFNFIEDNLKKLSDTVNKYATNLNTIFTFLSASAKIEKELADAELKEISAAHTKIVESKKTSNEKLATLHNQSVNLSGGRSEAIQQQVDAEMAKNEELAAQETQLATKKAAAEKKQKAAEKKQQKLDIQTGIVKSIASIAQGVTKCYELGPIAGTIFAAMVIAAGAVQIATQQKQLEALDKKADGGLLRGRRHSEGGMRIEGTNIEVEGGEYVINRQTTDHNIGLIRYINSQRRPLGEDDIASYFRSPRAIHTPLWRQQMENGGMMPTVQFTDPDITNSELLTAIRQIRIEPRVAVTDIIRVQDQMTRVDNWVGM